MTAWTPELTDQLHALRDSGLATKEIAERMHLPAISVAAKLRADAKSRGSLDTIYPLLEEGIGTREIARRLGLSVGAVAGKIHRGGLTSSGIYSGPTTMDRLAALHAMMDRTLAECGRR